MKVRTMGWGLSLAVALAAAGGTGWAHEGHGAHDEAAEGKAATITGEVIDVACYTSDGPKGKGADHKECATKCVSGGMPVGFLTDKGGVILAVTADHTSANTLLLPFLATKVKASGKLHERGGVKVLAVDRVEPMGAMAPAAAAAAAPAKPAVKEVWVCPMDGYTSDKPGKCPKCGMNLEKKAG